MKPLILWGGVDLNPKYYDTYVHSKTQKPNYVRDEHEVALVNEAMFTGRPIIGVCRGAQLLCVMNDGMLYQHSEGHNRAHDIYTNTGEVFGFVAADHHQVMCPQGREYEILAYDRATTKVWVSEHKTKLLPTVPEVIWWPSTKCLAIQPHPEWETTNSPFVRWINDIIYNLIGEKGVF